MTIGTGGEAGGQLAGFSSRSYVNTVSQFPQRDEGLMSMEPGFSNSKPTQDVTEKVVESDEAENKVVEADVVEDKAVKPTKRTAKKS